MVKSLLNFLGKPSEFSLNSRNLALQLARLVNKILCIKLRASVGGGEIYFKIFLFTVDFITKIYIK